MKKGRFLWSAHRITERQKAGKARSIKGKQLKNSCNTASRLPVALPSSASADSISAVSRTPSIRAAFSFCHGRRGQKRLSLFLWQFLWLLRCLWLSLSLFLFQKNFFVFFFYLCSCLYIYICIHPFSCFYIYIYIRKIL